MQSTNNNTVVKKDNGSFHKYSNQPIHTRQEKGTINSTTKNFTINDKCHVPKKHLPYKPYYNPHYANFPPMNYVARPQYKGYYQHTSNPSTNCVPSTKNEGCNQHTSISNKTYVPPTKNEGYNQHTSTPVCAKSQDSICSPINSEKSHSNSKPHYHPYQKNDNSKLKFNSFHRPVFKTQTIESKAPADGGKIKAYDKNRELLDVIASKKNMYTFEYANSSASSINSSGYSSCSSSAYSTTSDSSFAEILSETVNPNNVDVLDSRSSNSVKSDLVYDMESNSLILTKPYEIVDAPIALAPM